MLLPVRAGSSPCVFLSLAAGSIISSERVLKSGSAALKASQIIFYGPHQDKASGQHGAPQRPASTQTFSSIFYLTDPFRGQRRAEHTQSTRLHLQPHPGPAQTKSSLFHLLMLFCTPHGLHIQSHVHTVIHVLYTYTKRIPA